MSDFRKRGQVKRTLKYINKEGEEKNQYITVGDYFSTDHGTRKALKLYATANTDEVWLNIYEDDEKDGKELTHDFNKKVTQDVVLEDINDKPIDLSEIPF